MGTIGYQLLSNHSIGSILSDQLKALPWATSISIEEMNWGPIAIVQEFQTREVQPERVVFLTAIERAGREIGEPSIFRWGGNTPSLRDIQARIGDAVTGVISVENLLIIGEYFQIWPDEVFILDVEPGPETAGEYLSVELGERVAEYFGILKNLCLLGESPGQDVQILFGDQISIH